MKDFNIFAALLQLLQTLCNVINRRFVMDKKELVAKLLAVKEASGKTYDEIAEALDLCNIYVAQLFRAQAQLKKETAPKLAKLVPQKTQQNCWVMYFIGFHWILNWWRRGESNPRPKGVNRRRLHAYSLI